MVNLNKNEDIRMQNLFIFLFILSFFLMGLYNRTWHEVLAAVVPEELSVTEETANPQQNVPAAFHPENGEAEVTVYTYGGEVYTVRGELKVQAPENGGREYLLEIDGSVEKQESPEENVEKIVAEMVSENADHSSVSLTVHTGEDIYGFYGKGRMAQGEVGAVQGIEISGHKEGFYDGEE